MNQSEGRNNSAPELHPIGTSLATGLQVYALAIPSMEDLPESIPLPSNKFTCFLAWNAADVDTAWISIAMAKLLRLGCVYLCAWGQDCERVHDIMDEEIVGDGDVEWQELEIVTTWHSTETLSEALDFFLDQACPSECHRQSCCSALVLSIGGDSKLALGLLRRLFDRSAPGAVIPGWPPNADT